MVDTGAGKDGRRSSVPTDADAALEAALTALRLWADEVGVDAVRVIGPLAGLVAEQRVCALLGLAPAANTIQAGWDATDENGRTYRIKARAFTGRRSIGSSNYDWGRDACTLDESTTGGIRTRSEGRATRHR
jgi:hypothetical protein